MGSVLDNDDRLLADFCTVTASVQHGIPVHVSLKRTVDQDAA